MTRVLKQFVKAAGQPEKRRAESVPLRNIAQDEDGSMLVFGMIIFVVMTMMGGLAIDLMRYEQRRTELQNTLDRSVLAAAALKQTLKGDEVVRDYFNKAGLSQYLTSVTAPDPTLNAKVVSAKADSVLQPYFLQMMGVDTVKIATSSTATEQITNVEVSLVLDISGSMRGSRLTALKPAARSFVTTLLANADPGKVSISLVPYNSQVNIGRPLMNAFNVTANHNQSSCIELPSDVFGSINISTTAPFKHNAHFDPWTNSLVSKSSMNLNCNSGSESEVVALSDSETNLHGAINGLYASGYTSIELGTKWGAFLLNNGARSALQGLFNANLIDAKFAARPLNPSTAEVLKVLVVMTDGDNTQEYKINDPYNSGLSGIWRKGTDNNYISIYKDRSGDYDWFWPKERTWNKAKKGTSSGQKELTWQEVWDEFPVGYVASKFFAASDGQSTASWENKFMSGVYQDAKNTRMQQICAAAKTSGITIYGIGFEAPSNGRKELLACSSTASHYYDASTTDIASVFKTIATNIKQLRLTQ